MAPSEQLRDLRELNMRLKIKNEEMARLREELVGLREQRDSLKASLDALPTEEITT